MRALKAALLKPTTPLAQEFFSLYPTYLKQGQCFWDTFWAIGTGPRVWISYSTRTSPTNHVSTRPFPGGRPVTFPRFLALSLNTLFFSEDKLSAVVNIPAPSLVALGGVKQVATSLVVPRKAEGFDRAWKPNTWPTQMTNFHPTWDGGLGADLTTLRPSEFVYHFPEPLVNPRLPERFDVDLSSRFFSASQIGAEQIVPAAYTRNFLPSQVERVVLDNFTAIGQVLMGDMSLDTLKNADTQASFSRALGSRGQRLQLGWEANIIPRWQAIRNLAATSSSNRQYTEMCFRLMASYSMAVVTDNLTQSIQNHLPFVTNTATNVQIVHINALTPIPVPPAPGAPPAPPVQNGEHEFWLPNTQSALMHGTAQFIDAEGMSTQHIAALVGALAPTTSDNIPHLRYQAPRPPTPPGSPITVIGSTSSRSSSHGRAPNPNPIFSYTANVARHTFPNGTTHIYVHHGNSPIPGAADQAWIQAHAFDYPSASILASVIRFISLRHGLASELVAAFDAVLYRGVAFKFSDALISSPAKLTQDIVDSSGHFNLYLPRNNTSAGYFDVFFSPAFIDTELDYFLSMIPDQLVNNFILANHARATSISWAAKAGGFVGEVWALGQAGGQQFLRNHSDKWLHRYYDETNLWIVLHSNAQATQYGFCPSALTRRIDEGLVIDWWQPYAAPSLTNHYLELWMMQTIPTFQVLPYYDEDASSSHVQWAEGTPDQVSSRYTRTSLPQVKLAREIEPFPGHTWLGDGGADYNAQFYAAQGNDDQFSFNGGVSKLSLRRWEATYARSFPVAPVNGATHWLAPVGAHFSDFLAPGSIRSYRMQNDRVVAWGVTPLEELSHLESKRWWDAASGQAHSSLMVNYVAPTQEHYEIDSLANYSVTLWTSNNLFAAMTFNNVQEVIKGDGFNIANVKPTQNPFSLRFDSAPKPYMAYQPARITTTTAKVLRITNTKPKERAQDINKQIAATAEIRYKTSYPVDESELPPMNPGYGIPTKDGINYVPRPYAETVSSSRSTTPCHPSVHPAEAARLRAFEDKMSAVEQKADEDFKQQELLFKVEEAKRAVQQAMAKTPPCLESTKDFRVRQSRNKSSKKGKKPAATAGATGGPPQPTPHIPQPNIIAVDSKASNFQPIPGSFSGPAGKLPQNVEPNDHNAASAQYASNRFGFSFAEALKGRAPASVVGGSRRPISPRAEAYLQNRHSGAYSATPPLPVNPQQQSPLSSQAPAPGIPETTAPQADGPSEYSEDRIASSMPGEWPELHAPTPTRGVSWVGSGAAALDQVLRNLYNQTRPPPKSVTTPKN